MEPSSRGDGTGPSIAQTLSTTSLSCTSNPAINGSNKPVDLGFQDLGVESVHPSGQKTLSQLFDGGSFPTIIQSSLYEADLQLKDDDLLKAVLSSLTSSHLASFPFSPNINFSLNLVSNSVSAGKDDCGLLPIAAPIYSLPSLQEKDTVFDPGDGLLAPLETFAPLLMGYNLRSSARKGAGGFGRGKSPAARGMGRISFLARAQDRAMMDVHDGRQISIERALRARQSLKSGV